VAEENEERSDEAISDLSYHSEVDIPMRRQQQPKKSAKRSINQTCLPESGNYYPAKSLLCFLFS
jgi:hypothetical protein